MLTARKDGENHYCGPCQKTTAHAIDGGNLVCVGCGREKFPTSQANRFLAGTKGSNEGAKANGAGAGEGKGSGNGLDWDLLAQYP